MRKSILACAGAMLLAACTTPQQKAAQMQAEVDRMVQIYGPACTRLGYASNSDQWRGCVVQLSVKEEAYRYGYPRFHAGYARPHWAYDGYWSPYW